jgi:hypothetical protein
MFYVRSYTTDSRDPQMVVKRMSRISEVCDYLFEKNMPQAWPGSNNFHRRLAEAVEVVGFQTRKAEEEVLREYYPIGSTNPKLSDAYRLWSRLEDYARSRVEIKEETEDDKSFVVFTKVGEDGSRTQLVKRDNTLRVK